MAVGCVDPKRERRRPQADVAPNLADVAPIVCRYGAKRIVTHCRFEPFQWVNAIARGARPLAPIAHPIGGSFAWKQSTAPFSNWLDDIGLIPIIARWESEVTAYPSGSGNKMQKPQSRVATEVFVEGDQPATARGRKRREIGAGPIAPARIAGDAPTF
jgi:hypothetical protein